MRTFTFVVIQTLIFLLLTMAYGLQSAKAESDAVMTYRSGDLLTLPVRKGNFMLLLWGGEGPRIWYDAQAENFTFMPVRNYTTVFYDVTRHTPEGDYQFVEIDADQNPADLSNWKWLRTHNVRIVKCDGFKEC